MPPESLSRDAPKNTGEAVLVQAKIKELDALEVRSPVEFAEALADNIMEPDPIETQAFRSEDLAFKSLKAARYLIDHSGAVMKHRRRGSKQQQATREFMNRVGQERRLLEYIVNGIRAAKGQIPNAPNPRQRALRRLATENLKGDVPRGRFRELMIEEQEIDKERKRQAKLEQKQRRQEAKKRDRGNGA